MALDLLLRTLRPKLAGYHAAKFSSVQGIAFARSTELDDPYKTLGIQKHSTQDEIKNAYRALANKFHPDLNRKSGEAERMFKEVNSDNEILGDPDSRAKFDRGEWVEPVGNATHRRPQARALVPVPSFPFRAPFPLSSLPAPSTEKTRIDLMPQLGSTSSVLKDSPWDESAQNSHLTSPMEVPI